MLEIQPGRRGVAIMNIPATLSLFDSHFPRFPVLPGVLLLQAMARLSSRVVGDGWRLRAAHRIQFRRFVQPGDQVVITAEVTADTDEVIELRAKAQIADSTVATARRLVLERV
ncbi:3-hydroxyacyl-ACP dehydratase FabZ family protein [Micromonospora sp. Llam0]|uniref:3-hydroxyacyl-ACP dehydratase FabZ family protein n=1 Tax=Micromonospora sp. Llam0 TaxID=2485143 RepID=UPI0018F2AC37|nr:hypothetical protein [Micromonospora sp. Llam0]